MKNLITTSLHAFFDYGAALILLAAPWLFYFEEIDMAKQISIFSGILVLLLSFLTRYEGGLLRLIPMPFHLVMDVILGLFLILSPWIFGFSAQTFIFHVVIGLFSVSSGLLTYARPPEFMSLKGT